MKKNKKSVKKKSFIYLGIFIVILGVVSAGYYYFNKESFNNTDLGEKIEEPKISLEEIKNYYSDYVKLMNGSSLYIKEGDSYVEVSNIVGEIEVSLDASYEVIDEYFKVLNSDYYVKYDSVSKIEGLSLVNNEYRYYKNYIPYNENIVLNENSKLFVDDINYYEVNGGSYPIIIKDTDRYGIEFNNRLVYVNKSDVLEVIGSQNTTEVIADGVSVLNYHFVVSAEEMKSCAQSICIREDKFDSQIKYLKDNNYYGVSMRDLELFIDGKIQLPRNSVGITIDDGWYVQRAITILERYQILGTLFLIGSLESPLAYQSSYLELHSHGWSIHGGNDCPGKGWRGGLHCFDRERVLEDLRKSRESLNNTTYFCYPFYEVSTRGIDLLKEAGFTMAFAGQKSDSKTRVGTDKFRIPRYVIYGTTSMNTFISYVD